MKLICPNCKGKKCLHYQAKCGDGRGFTVPCPICKTAGKVSVMDWLKWKVYRWQRRGPRGRVV